MAGPHTPSARPHAQEGFIWALPVGEVPALARLDAVLASRITVALEQHGDFAAALTMLGDPSSLGCFPTFANERAMLMQLWFQAVELRAGAETPLERRDARVASPVPRNIGCPYGSGVGYPGCTYW